MNRIISTILIGGLGLLSLGCDFGGASQGDPNLTGRTKFYPLFSGSPRNYTGAALLQERTDAGTRIIIQLDGEPATGLSFPVHIHAGAASVNEAPLLATLNPVDGVDLTSVTEFYQLADGTIIGYSGLLELNAHIRIHLGDSPEDRMVILAIGNIGSNFREGEDLSEIEITMCSTEIEK